MWALYVIVMMANLELYQTLFGISDPRWSCSTVKFRGSAALGLFLQSWSSPKQVELFLLTNRWSYRKLPCSSSVPNEA
jgi:hypothetical protein